MIVSPAVTQELAHLKFFLPILPNTPEDLPQLSQETVIEPPTPWAALTLLTPIQQFLRYTRMSKPREPK